MLTEGLSGAILGVLFALTLSKKENYVDSPAGASTGVHIQTAGLMCVQSTEISSIPLPEKESIFPSITILVELPIPEPIQDVITSLPIQEEKGKNKFFG